MAEQNAHMPTTADEFRAMVDVVEAGVDYEQPAAFALGLATVEDEGNEARVIDVQYTRRNYASNFGTAATLSVALEQPVSGFQTGGYLINPYQIKATRRLFTPFHYEAGHGNIETLMHMETVRGDVYPQSGDANISNPRVPILGVVRNWEDEPTSVADIYLRLYALSDRHRLPNTANIVPGRDFPKLPNTVITEALGTFSVDKWNAVSELVAFRGLSTAVRVLDKFPRMLDHVVPTGVRVADPSRVRLGAHLGEGTTVMHEGFANFNAGTVGASMVEGRISAGVLVGEGSDIGGGASIMGTMSGGGKEVISIGEKCLLEANSGTGISLGDNCRVEAGTYVKSTTRVKLPDGTWVKAEKLSGMDNMMFRRNSISGEVELVPNEGDEWGGLNAALHSN